MEQIDPFVTNYILEVWQHTVEHMMDIDDVFTYHPAEPDQIPVYEAIRGQAKELAKVILAQVPQCADRSAAIRLLREAVMTANAAVALRGRV